MAFQQHITPALRSTAPKPLIAGGILMAAVVFVGIVFALINSGFDSGFPYIYMLPWLIAMALVMAAPSAYLYYKGRFELYNPIVFATFSILLPGLRSRWPDGLSRVFATVFSYVHSGSDCRSAVHGRAGHHRLCGTVIRVLHADRTASGRICRALSAVKRS